MKRWLVIQGYGVVPDRRPGSHIPKAREGKYSIRKHDLDKLHMVPTKGWRLKRVCSGFSERDSLKVWNGAELGESLDVRAALENERLA